MILSLKFLKCRQQQHTHKLPTEVVSNRDQCVTFICQVRLDASLISNTDSYFNMLGQRSINRTKKLELIGYFCICYARDYEDRIELKIIYQERPQKFEDKVIYLSKSAYYQGKIVEVFKENGIICFDSEMPYSKMNRYLQQLIRSTLPNETEVLPKQHGFGEYRGKLCFVSEEFCEEHELPGITKLSFRTGKDKTFAQIGNMFYKIAGVHNDPMMFMLLNLLRMAGLLATPLREGVLWNKLVFLKGEADRLSKYFQIYDRGNI